MAPYSAIASPQQGLVWVNNMLQSLRHLKRCDELEVPITLGASSIIYTHCSLFHLPHSRQASGWSAFRPSVPNRTCSRLTPTHPHDADLTPQLRLRLCHHLRHRHCHRRDAHHDGLRGFTGRLFGRRLGSAVNCGSVGPRRTAGAGPSAPRAAS